MRAAQGKVCGSTCECPRVTASYAPVRRAESLRPLWLDRHVTLDDITDVEWAALRAYLILRHDAERERAKREQEARDAADKLKRGRKRG